MRNMGWANLKLDALPRRFNDSRGIPLGRWLRSRRANGGGRRIPSRLLHSRQLHRDDLRQPRPGGLDLRQRQRLRLPLRHLGQDGRGGACAWTAHRPPANHRRRDDHGPERAEVPHRLLIDRGRPDRGAERATQNVEPRHQDRRHLDRRERPVRPSTSRTRPAGGTTQRGGEPRGAQHVGVARRTLTRCRRPSPATPGLRLRRPHTSTRPTATADGRGLGLASSAACAGTTSDDGAPLGHARVLNASASVTATGNAALTMPTSLLHATSLARPGQALREHVQRRRSRRLRTRCPPEHAARLVRATSSTEWPETASSSRSRSATSRRARRRASPPASR